MIRVLYHYRCDHPGCTFEETSLHDACAGQGSEVFSLLPSGWIIVSRSESGILKAICPEHRKAVPV